MPLQARPCQPPPLVVGESYVTLCMLCNIEHPNMWCHPCHSVMLQEQAPQGGVPGGHSSFSHHTSHLHSASTLKTQRPLPKVFPYIELPPIQSKGLNCGFVTVFGIRLWRN